MAKALADNLTRWRPYLTTLGIPALREAIAGWAERRFNVPKGWLDPARNILPVNGTREALFAFTQTVVNRGDDALVVSPNPFYQIYEGAALQAPSRTTCPAWLNMVSTRISTLLRPTFGSAARSCSAVAGQPYRCTDPARHPENRSHWPTNTTS